MKRTKVLKYGMIPVAVIAAGCIGYFVMAEANSGGTFQSKATATPKGPFTYDAYAAVLKRHVNKEGLVDYEGLKAEPDKLEMFLAQIAQLDCKVFDAWPEQKQIAFWINAYNALTLKVIVQHYPIKARLTTGLVYPANSIRQIPGVWDKKKWVVMGR